MEELTRMDRRQAIKWMLAASATLSVLDARNLAASTSTGYGTDPNLMEVYKPGDLWPLTFSKQQHRVVAALADVILPADDRSPSASQLKVPDFLDEWISAPYPKQRADREEILAGLDWLEKESGRRFSKGFTELSAEQQHQICDDICSTDKAPSGMQAGVRFFAKFRELVMGGFYSTPQGFKDIQYLGNVPLTKFDGPPPEVLKYLKLT
ncbi:MAG TPA: gluconate 2-dehydrogenase subunit 3 family protein [Verrucomicrobiae bacterium]|nr:gluconate 2-dehydrogenase subunit 3 family protein [Verrucomicrobiae bacterium]